MPINTPGFLTYTPEKRLTVNTDEASHGLHPDELTGDYPRKEGLPGDLVVKNLPAKQVTQEKHVYFLVQEDLLEKEMATHSTTLAWRIPWTEEPGRPQPRGSQRTGHDLVTKPPTTTTPVSRRIGKVPVEEANFILSLKLLLQFFICTT